MFRSITVAIALLLFATVLIPVAAALHLEVEIVSDYAGGYYTPRFADTAMPINFTADDVPPIECRGDCMVLSDSFVHDSELRWTTDGTIIHLEGPEVSIAFVPGEHYVTASVGLQQARRNLTVIDTRLEQEQSETITKLLQEQIVNFGALGTLLEQQASEHKQLDALQVTLAMNADLLAYWLQNASAA